ncbi:MAG: hypothetical protein P9L96_03875 [Candidatus Gygaella obscura]|nr:hypothetical protein [Candidatus Gygaella obscura]
MKKIASFTVVALLGLFLSMQAIAQEVKPFNVYTDKNSSDNHFAPSGWMGDFGDLRLDDQNTDNPYSGGTAVKITYSGKRSQNQGWAGIFWQNPPNNWGSKKGGFDLTGLNKLTFMAKGEKGAEAISKIKVGGIKGQYADTAEVEIGPIELTSDWQEYSLNLVDADLSYISGGFAFVINADLNPEGAAIYLDDIKFVNDSKLKAEVKKAEKLPFYVYSDSSSIGNHFIPSGWMGDHGDIKLKTNHAEDPYLGKTCVRITYSAEATQGARWAGMFWQNPPNNWGDIDGGYDLSNATTLTFWARGEKGGERLEEFKVGGIMGRYSDSDTAMIGPVVLSNEWKQYSIDLKGKDMSYIMGGFAWATNMDVNPEGAIFYIDEIVFE